MILVWGPVGSVDRAVHAGFRREVHHVCRFELSKKHGRVRFLLQMSAFSNLNRSVFAIGARFSGFPAQVSLSTMQTAFGVPLMNDMPGHGQPDKICSTSYGRTILFWGD